MSGVLSSVESSEELSLWMILLSRQVRLPPDHGRRDGVDRRHWLTLW